MWSFSFFYYTLLKYFRNTPEVKDIAPIMAIVGMSMWWLLVYVDLGLYLLRECATFDFRYIFSSDPEMEGVIVFFLILFSHLFYFIILSRGHISEIKYDKWDSLRVKKLNKVSWFVFWFGILFFVLQVKLFIGSVNC